MLNAANPDLAGAALPLVVRWDKEQSLRAEVKPLIQVLLAKLEDPSVPDRDRGQIAANLLGVRNLNPDILPAVSSLLGSSQASVALQNQILVALGNSADPAAGEQLAKTFSRLLPELLEPAFAQIVKRADWSLALLEEVKAGNVSLVTLGPGNIHRLRTHSDRSVAERAAGVVDAIRGPQVKEKEALIASLLPRVEQPGSIENGKALFTQNCATCHQFKGQGRDLAPDLTGMGAHGAAELLTHIVDPNRLVEPNWVSVSIETKDDQAFDGIVSRENASTVTLRNANGDYEIRQSEIATRRSTGLSLMPEGFEALGGEGLRDLIACIAAEENRFRILDLTPAFTANSTRGIYLTPEAANESLRFARFGVIKVEGIPFEVVHPSRTPTGHNLIVLKGGRGLSRRYPQQVKFKAGLQATRLHFLGGVGGWAYPYGGAQNENIPVAKVTLHFEGGDTQEILLKNGLEIADYNGHAEVPGSREARGLVRYGQVRWFTKPVERNARITEIVLESFDNAVAPTFVAITAELAEPAAGKRPAAITGEPTPAQGGKIRTLIVGGGSSHDFDRWFHKADLATLEKTGLAAVSYTDQIDTILPRLDSLDVLCLTLNQPITNTELRKAMFQFAESGKGLLLVHAGLWYNWKDWPEYNRVLAGGGARSHPRYGEFEVKVTEPDHPLMAGVPASFKISDELYRFEPDPEGTPIHVLATALEEKAGKTYPVVWIVKHPKAKIACITLGHDGGAHEHPAFQRLLQNGLKWAAESARLAEAKP
jgi:putative heme-binding domain-containing protein